MVRKLIARFKKWQYLRNEGRVNGRIEQGVMQDLPLEVIKLAFTAGFNSGCLESNIKNFPLCERKDKLDEWLAVWLKKKGLA